MGVVLLLFLFTPQLSNPTQKNSHNYLYKLSISNDFLQKDNRLFLFNISKKERAMKSKKDIKFIIYQSLYIFVICVIAIKGADLDLTKVINDNGIVVQTGYAYVDTTNKVIIEKVNLADMIHFDSSKYLIVSKDDYNNHPDDYTGMRVVNTSTGMGNITDIPIQEKKQDEPLKIEDPKKEIITGNLELHQYHNNLVPNQGDNAITIAGITIPAHSTGKVTLGGESSVVISAGDVKKTVSVRENKKPQIMFQRMTLMSDEAKVTVLQRNVCYRVTISDDFTDQLDVKFSGGVTVNNKGGGVYDITMNAFGSRQAFDNYIDNKNAPYSTGFTVTVSDRIAPHKITGQQSFVFGEW